MYLSRTGFSLSTVTSGVVRGAQISPGSWNVNAARRAAASPLLLEKPTDDAFGEPVFASSFIVGGETEDTL